MKWCWLLRAINLDFQQIHQVALRWSISISIDIIFTKPKNKTKKTTKHRHQHQNNSKTTDIKRKNNMHTAFDWYHWAGNLTWFVVYQRLPLLFHAVVDFFSPALFRYQALCAVYLLCQMFWLYFFCLKFHIWYIECCVRFICFQFS